MLVTTFRPSDWNRYAERFVNSFLAKWPEEERLRIYFQGVLRADYLQHPRVEYVPLSSIPKLEELRDAMGQTKHLRGMMTVEDGNQEYSYRHDAHRWSLKAFAMAHAATTIKEPLAWCDADTFWHSDVPPQFLSQLVPEPAHMAVLERPAVPMYPETGFVVINPHHPINSSFWRLYVNIWTSGAITMLREWHCCEVLQFTYQALKSPRINLAAGFEDCMHPFINSLVGEYGDHMKGARKGDGHSHLDDLIVDRSDHPYWRQFYLEAAK